MPNSPCKNYYEKLEELKDLQTQFQQELKSFETSRKSENIWETRKKIEEIIDYFEKKGLFTISEKEAKEIMGEEFFGPQEIEKAFGFKVLPESVPKIPFSKEDLERAKELNQFLILRVDKTPDGNPLSLVKMNEILKGKVSDGKKFLYSSDGEEIKDDAWYKNEDFIKTEHPRITWALVSKEVIPNSTDKNYLQQTAELADYIKNSVFKEKEIPKEFQEAIKEFEEEKGEIEKLMSSNWKKAAEKLAGLKINQLFRQNSAEAIYDLAVYFQNKGKRILENGYTWISSRDSGGELVDVGDFASVGVGVDSRKPGNSNDDLGVSFSRSSAVGG